jgi:hypothetical protein
MVDASPIEIGRWRPENYGGQPMPSRFSNGTWCKAHSIIKARAGRRMTAVIRADLMMNRNALLGDPSRGAIRVRSDTSAAISWRAAPAEFKEASPEGVDCDIGGTHAGWSRVKVSRLIRSINLRLDSSPNIAEI